MPTQDISRTISSAIQLPSGTTVSIFAPTLAAIGAVETIRIEAIATQQQLSVFARRLAAALVASCTDLPIEDARRLAIDDGCRLLRSILDTWPDEVPAAGVEKAFASLVFGQSLLAAHAALDLLKAMYEHNREFAAEAKANASRIWRQPAEMARPSEEVCPPVAKSTSRPVDPNQNDRDTFIYERAVNGNLWKEIRAAVNTRWPDLPLEDDRSVRDAAKRFAKRTGRTQPINRKTGKPLKPR